MYNVNYKENTRIEWIEYVCPVRSHESVSAKFIRQMSLWISSIHYHRVWLSFIMSSSLVKKHIIQNISCVTLHSNSSIAPKKLPYYNNFNDVCPNLYVVYWQYLVTCFCNSWLPWQKRSETIKVKVLVGVNMNEPINIIYKPLKSLSLKVKCLITAQ